MESLSIGLSTSPPSLNHPKTQNSTSKSIFSLGYSISQHRNSRQIHPSISKETTSYLSSKTFISHGSTPPEDSHFLEIVFKSHVSIFSTGAFFPLSCFASEATIVNEEVPNKINLEYILVSIDEFFNRNPFFVAGVTFIWLVAIPLIQEYFRKYKFISAIDGFRKLRDDPNCQLLDIRDKKSLAFLNSPNLKILNKSVLQVEFREGDEDSFVKAVLKILKDPAKTSICIIDNFDGNSIKAAEALVKDGFKEAYAIRGGIRGKKGWQEIQESLLPPSVHIYAQKKPKVSNQPTSGGENFQNKGSGSDAATCVSSNASKTEKITNGSLKTSTDLTLEVKRGARSSSPYPNYPDLKPPSSPTPSKPKG